MTFHLTPNARRDVDHLVRVISEDRGVTAGVEVAERLLARARRVLVPFPGAGRRRLEFGNDVRSYAVPPYIVVYRIGKRGVAVLRILHGYRDLSVKLVSFLLHPAEQLSA